MVESWSAESPELSKITLPTETPTRHLFFLLGFPSAALEFSSPQALRIVNGAEPD